MVYCRGCGNQIHESAPTCPHCGSPQLLAPNNTLLSQSDDGPLWVPIMSFVLGIVCILAFFDDSEWDIETILGLGIFSIAGLTLGSISLAKQKSGKGMAIAGVVMSSVALLAFLGMLLT